ncbi:MAG: prolipoprotein diacylglyceryl transferase [Lysobacterales bacterium CG02_land_8_20_14_3_00_62_12]|nr:MAG: prolipoprotein diacylglyceryl transferase [Xanthomonadales bacterium CG02_land_8_20_14_3_00_62_12]
MHFFHDIDPVAWQIGPLAVHWYGLTYLCAFATAYWLGLHRLRAGRLGINAEQFSDLLFVGMLGVILGGRIGYMLVYGRDELAADPLSLLRVWEGGMSFHGGLVGVLLAGLWWSRKQQRAVFDVIDFVAPLVPLGLGFGRLGNFIGGELWGRQSDLPWAMIFPKSFEHPGVDLETLRAQAAAGLLDAQARHPSQLYQALLEGLLLFLIVWFYSAKPRPRYAVSGLFALGYGLFRFAVEFVREPDAQMGFIAFDWMTTGQLLSLPLVLVGLGLLWLSRRRPVSTFPLPGGAADAARGA